jgi:uncharacterized protein (TIGR03435 family)
MGRGQLQGQGTSLEFLVHALSQQLGRSVLDRTGLKGNHDFTLQWTPDSKGLIERPRPNPPGHDVYCHSGAAWTETGSAKGPVEVLVIDHIEKPSEN